MRLRADTDIGSPPPRSVSRDEPESTSTAQALLADVAAGDERAFEQLYDLLATPVLGLVTWVLRDRARAEEVTQEVFVEVWCTAPRYQPAHGCPLTWVLALARRRAVRRVGERR